MLKKQVFGKAFCSMAPCCIKHAGFLQFPVPGDGMVVSIIAALVSRLIQQHKHIYFRDDIPAGELEEIIARMDTRIKEEYPAVKRVFVEAEARRVKSVSR